MKAVFLGASALAVTTARRLIERGRDVVIVEQDKERIDELADELDCGFLHGDGTRPDILREAEPSEHDVLFCLGGHDQANIIASLVGRSLGFKRVVTRIEDPGFEHICMELGLQNTIVPDTAVGRYLADMFEGQDVLQLSALLKGAARVFAFVVGDDEAGPLNQLDLPPETRVMCLYRNGEFILPDSESRVKGGDELVLITHQEQLAELRERWGGEKATGSRTLSAGRNSHDGNG